MTDGRKMGERKKEIPPPLHLLPPRYVIAVPEKKGHVLKIVTEK